MFEAGLRSILEEMTLRTQPARLVGAEGLQPQVRTQEDRTGGLPAVPHPAWLRIGNPPASRALFGGSLPTLQAPWTDTCRAKPCRSE